MLQRPASGDEVCGVWSRSQLLEMDERFTARVEAAFAKGLESRTAAARTVEVGKKRVTESEAIQRAWDWLWDKKGEASAAEVMEFVHARCPGVTVARVRIGLMRVGGRHPWLRASA